MPAMPGGGGERTERGPGVLMTTEKPNADMTPDEVQGHIDRLKNEVALLQLRARELRQRKQNLTDSLEATKKELEATVGTMWSGGRGLLPSAETALKRFEQLKDCLALPRVHWAASDTLQTNGRCFVVLKVTSKLVHIREATGSHVIVRFYKDGQPFEKWRKDRIDIERTFRGTEYESQFECFQKKAQKDE